MDTNQIFSISSARQFEEISLEVFRFQYTHNPVYKRFCDLLKVDPSRVMHVKEIPFMPIEFFKTHSLLAEGKTPQAVFTSSGTTGTTTSKHLVAHLSIYKESFTRAFEMFYGKVEEYAVLALLPSYLEREGSSLVYMAQHFIKKSQHPKSGFYLNNLESLKDALESLESQGQKVLLMGVSFALLDLVEAHRFQLQHSIVMETGGMKGRRKELIREELHAALCEGFGVPKIHSEYGMTELLSQAYSKGNGLFDCPPWMQLLIRDPEDALTLLPEGKTGGINVIDLANIYSCSFIATQDLGKIADKGKVEILGRFDNSDIRGCNLMVL